MRVLDIRFQGRAHAIGTLEHEGVIVDPGPESCAEALFAALGDTEVRGVLLTHIHLDHAGAAGRVVERFPEAQVYVHERGAPHVIDPSRLVASATRIYGDRMGELWGEIVPVDAAKVTVLSGDDGDAFPGWTYRYTPGHAVHHVAFKHLDSGLVHCGDVAGVRIGDGPNVPPTPPPDIDLGRWRASLDAIERWEPTRLCLTHFGFQEDPAAHLADLRAGLDRVEEAAQRLDAEGYADFIRAWIADAGVEGAEGEAYDVANPPETLYAGLSRYLAKKADGTL